MALSQSAARARSGKHWITPAGGIAFSLAFWTSHQGQNLIGLPLCIGLAIVKALEFLGIQCAQIKWPNDVLINSAKVGGILTEIASHTADASLVVLGIGMNGSSMPHNTFSYPITNIKTHLPKNDQEQWSEVRCIALLLQYLYTNITLFEDKGFSYFYSEWATYDALKNQRISALSATTGKTIQGTVAGISREGFLRLILDNEKEELIHDASIQRI